MTSDTTTSYAALRPSAVSALAGELRLACMRISRRVRYESTDLIAPHHFSVMCRLEESPRTPGELAEIERVSAPSMTRTVAGLVELGYVERTPGTTDKRQVIVALTDEARKVLKEIRRKRDAWMSVRVGPPRPRGAGRPAACHRDPHQGGRRVSPTFTSFTERNYRIFYAGSFVSNVGTWMGRVAQDWLVLTELTDHSSQALGIVTGLQFLPFLVLAPWAGAIADRFPRRQILLVTQSLLLVTSLLLAGLVLARRRHALAGLRDRPAPGRHHRHRQPGPPVVRLRDGPARQARQRGGAQQRVVQRRPAHRPGRRGPHDRGATAPAGPSSSTSAPSSSSSSRSRCCAPASLIPAPLTRGKGAIREGIHYVRNRPDIQVVMLLVFVLGTFGMNFQVTTALMATQEFGKGPTEYGILGSIMAIGSLTAALLSARRGEPRLRVLLISMAGFTLSTTAASLAPTYELFALALVPTGLAALTALTTANAMVQLRTDPARARSRHGALHGDLHGWHAHRRTDHRLDRRGLGSPLDHRHRPHRHRRHAGLRHVVDRARRQNVRVSYESQRSPRITIEAFPVRDTVTEPAPEAAR